MAVAAVGVAMKVTMMTGMVCIGLGQGVQPLLGYCVGAKKWDRYKSVLRFSLIFAFALSTALTIICYIFTNQIVSVFLTDAAAFDYGVAFSRILLCTSFLFGVFYVITNALQACGAATESLIVNISRQGIIYPSDVLTGGNLSRNRSYLGAARGRCSITCFGDYSLCQKVKETDVKWPVHHILPFLLDN